PVSAAEPIVVEASGVRNCRFTAGRTTHTRSMDVTVATTIWIVREAPSAAESPPKSAPTPSMTNTRSTVAASTATRTRASAIHASQRLSPTHSMTAPSLPCSGRPPLPVLLEDQVDPEGRLEVRLGQGRLDRPLGDDLPVPEEQHVGEVRRDLLDVVGHHDDRRGLEVGR